MMAFWDKGYEGASLEELQAAMGGISPPSFYAAFGSKEQLFFAAVGRYLETVSDRPVHALESAKTARAGVEAMLREAAAIYCDPGTPRGCLLFLGAINCTPANKSVQDRMHGHRTRVSGVIRQRLERGVTEGDVPEGIDLEPLVSLYASLAHGLPMRARDGASRAELLAGVTAGMAAWDHLAGPARTPGNQRAGIAAKRLVVAIFGVSTDLGALRAASPLPQPGPPAGPGGGLSLHEVKRPPPHNR
jgi:AcrR family transcriptional regulator